MKIKLQNFSFCRKKEHLRFFLSVLVFSCVSASYGLEPIMSVELKKSTSYLQQTVSGTVTDVNGQPIPGVNVLEKGTTNGVQTDFDGVYSISTSNQSATLVFSFVGFKTKEVAITNQTTLNVSLEEDISQLDEVVVVGYGTQSSSKVVSSVVQVTNKELNLEKRPVTNGYSALVGSVPGLVMGNNNGSPGAIPSIQIRGTSTIGEANDVLVIIDNFEGSLSDINPQDIESVSVLKDASAVAVYGARGANGVLLVTTKKAARNKKTTVSYNATTSMQTTPRLQQTVNSSQYMEFQNDIAPGTWDANSLSLANNGFYPDTNWIEEIFESTAVQQSHSLTLSGGSETTGYLMTGSYLTQEGLALGEDKFERLNLRLKMDTDINSWLNVGTNTLISNRTDKSVEVVGGSNVRGLPFYPVKTEDGLWASNGTADGANPVASASSGSFDESDLDRINVQLYAKITPLKGLTFEERISYIKTNEYARGWSNPFSSVGLDPTDPDSYTNPDSANRDYFIASTDERTLAVESTKSHNFRSLTSLAYEFEKGKHAAKAFLAIQSESGESETLAASRTGFLFDNIISLNQGELPNDSNIYDDGNTEIRGGNARTLSYIGRFNYSFDDKYLIEASFRRDGSSYFTDENKWGFFPSVALGWVASKEKFFDNINFVNQLKFRGSYGSAGSDGTLGSVTQQLVTYDASGYPLGGVSNARIGVDDFVNPDLIWETSTILNVGVDASLFQRKLQLSAEYFVNNRKDILDNISSTAYEYGFGDAQGNPYDVRSWGWDFNVSHKNTIGKFSYNIAANVSNYDNKITRIEGGSESNTRQIGLSVNNRFGYEVDGYFDSQEEIDTYTTTDGTLIDQSDVSGANGVGTYLGGFKYLDQLTIDSDGDGVMDTADGVINSDDRVTIDDNNDRNWNVGFNLGVSYENFTLSARFYGSFDNNQYWNSANVVDPFLGGGIPWTYQLDYWSETNTNALLPRPVSTSNENYNSSIDHFIVDAEFIKLQNVTLNYDFGENILNRFSFIKSMNLYLSMENIGVVWTNSPVYDYGWDPELGVNNVDYPLPFTTALGLNIKF
ncbi:MAG: TonB-dependent receptor [Algibacter sp.]|uniref:SusC/RagA family TonB-linked outer membrane protein n=1 Tax=Algibacter sp. TaxID=1872428 RepID=UPI0032979C87